VNISVPCLKVKMVFSKRNIPLVMFALSANPTQGARVAIHEVNADSTEWGRSCPSLESRFQNQQSRLVGAEGTAALVRSISWMRTLRRANARNCEFVTNLDLDFQAAADMADDYLRQSPCYEAAMDHTRALRERCTLEVCAHPYGNLPEEARSALEEESWAILLSENAECTPAGVEAPEVNESDEELEEELDDETDEVMEQLATQPSETSLIQNEQPIMAFAAGAFSWGIAAGLGWPVFIGAIVVGILLGMFCTHLVHMIVRIFRWIRCKVFGNSCSEYAPATWFRVLARGGCSLTGMFFGPLGLLSGFAGSAAIVGAAR